MDEASYKLLEWGLEEESCLQIKSQSLGTVVQFRDKEFLVLGQKEITRFESTYVKESYPYILTALVPIPKYDILIGVTAVSAEFIILFMSDLKKNIMTGVKINDQSVFNIIFSSESDTIITSGEHLITWSFNFTAQESTVVFTYPKIKISMKKIILSHIHSSIMNPPMFDFSREELYINDNKGNIHSYSLNGSSNGIVIKYGSNSQTACGYYENGQNFMTTNSNQGAVLWPKRAGGISKRFYIGTSASLAIQFIDDEYVAILDAKYMITLIDTKTSTFFNCYQSPIPIHRMFYFQYPYPRIVLCAGSSVILLKVNLPWRFWNPTFGRPISITRSNKRNEAARISVVLENSHVRLISPKTGSILTAATLTSLSTPVTCFYDRGIDESTKRDQLLIPLQDGVMQIFSTGQDPCQMIGSIDHKITCICQCQFRSERCFVFGTNVGQLLFYSYSTMKLVGRIISNYKYPIIGVFCDAESECLILSFDERLSLVSLKQEKEVGDHLNTKCSRLSLFFDRIAIYAAENGLITSVFVLNQSLHFHETSSMRLHDDKITGFSKGSSFFISCSEDKTVKVWSKEFHVLCKISLPLKLLKCCVMNGKRDILVATLNDIMIIKGSDVFGQNIDLEDEVFDNYDRKKDSLDNSYIMFREEEDGNEESLLNGRKKEESPKKSRFNARKRRIIEALKRQLAMQQEANEKFEDFDQIEHKPLNTVNLHNDRIPKPPDDEKKPQKKEKNGEEDSYEYVLEEEEEDRQSRASKQKTANKSTTNANANEEKENIISAKKVDEDKEKEELERKRKSLEKQKADKEREEKEKEILKMYNESKREKTVREPNAQPKTRPSRPRAKKANEESLSEDGLNDGLSSKSKEDDRRISDEASKKKGKDDGLESDESENQKKKSKDKKKNKNDDASKSKGKDKTNENINNKQNKDKDINSNSKNKSKEKDATSENKDKESIKSKDTISSSNKNKDEIGKTTKNTNNNDKNNESTSNKNKSKNKDKNSETANIKDKSKNKDKDKESTISKDTVNSKNKSKENSKKLDKDKNENENSKKQKSKTIKKNQPLPSHLLKSGYKNASSQTMDTSSLQKIGNIPKSVPSNIAVVPQITKVRRVRRSPTPPTNRPTRERRPLFDPNAARKRSSTPDPCRFLIDGSSPPVNLFFDINMVRKMVENGDKRYLPLLLLLERQGLKTSNFQSEVFKPRKISSLHPKSKNRVVQEVAPSWGVMVTLPPLNISQTRMQKSSQQAVSIPKEEEQEEKEQNETNTKEETKHPTNHIKESHFRFSYNNDVFNQDELFTKPAFILEDQLFPMKKVHKTSNHQRGSSVPNMNKTMAEMKFAKEQLMLKIKEKRAKEAAQSKEDETESMQNNRNHEIESKSTSNEFKIDFGEEEEENNDDADDLMEKNQPKNQSNLHFNPRFANRNIINNQEIQKAPTFVEPIMPIHLRSSKDVRYIRRREISPFACKRYRMVVDSNGPKDANNFKAYRNPTKNVNNNNQSSSNAKTLIDQYVRSPPRQLLRPLQIIKNRAKH